MPHCLYWLTIKAFDHRVLKFKLGQEAEPAPCPNLNTYLCWVTWWRDCNLLVLPSMFCSRHRHVNIYFLARLLQCIYILGHQSGWPVIGFLNYRYFRHSLTILCLQVLNLTPRETNSTFPYVVREYLARKNTSLSALTLYLWSDRNLRGKITALCLP